MKVKTEEKTEVKIPRTPRQAKNATAKLEFGQELVGKKCQVLWNDNEWYTGCIVEYSIQLN